MPPPPVYPIEGIFGASTLDELGFYSLNQSFVIVGTCGNGDPIVVNIGEEMGAVFYVNHEKLDGTNTLLRDISVRVADGLKDLILGIDEDETFPISYHDANKS